MPHESTVNPYEQSRGASSSHIESINSADIAALTSAVQKTDANGVTEKSGENEEVFADAESAKGLKPITPSELTHHEDFDDDDEDSSEASKSSNDLKAVADSI